MDLDSTKAFTGNVISLISMLSKPLNNMNSAYSNINEIPKEHFILSTGFKELTAKEKALIYLEINTNLINAVLNSIVIGKQTCIFIQEEFSISNLLNMSPHVCRLMGLSGVFASASFSLSAYRALRKKQSELDDLNLLLDDLKDELNLTYQDVTPYLGTTFDLNKNNYKQNMQIAQAYLKQHQAPSKLIAELKRHDLQYLIQNQAYAIFYDKNQCFSLKNAYQIAIDEKIHALSVKNSIDNNRLKNLVIAKKHQAYFDIAAPELIKNKNHQALHVLLSVVCLGIAIAIAVVSFGTLTPAVGLALINASTIMNTVLSRHKAYLTQREAKVKSMTRKMEEDVELFLEQNNKKIEKPFENDKKQESIIDRLIGAMDLRPDSLSKPINDYVAGLDFLEANDNDKLLILKEKTKEVMASSCRWKQLSLSYHPLFVLIQSLDDSDIATSHEKIKIYENEIRHQESVATRRARRAERSLQAKAALETDLDLSEIDENNAPDVAHLFTA
jgi:hypothetical protein